MKLNRKAILILLLLICALLVAGCQAEQTPYEINDAENFTVSVKYDANGGIFTTNTSVIVDSYNLSRMEHKNGQAQIALLSPDNAVRGNDAFAAINNGHFLAGWYTQRTETTDGYVYSGKWDFDNDLLTVDVNGTYTSAEPVLTLYAAWVPMFAIEFYDLDSGTYLDTITFDPATVGDILVPAWDEATGAIEMHRFPEKSGYTFCAAYYDPEGTVLVDTAAVRHTGVLDEATGTAVGGTIQLYLDWTEGEWYHIYNVEQFQDNASVAGNYVLHADLDFAGEIWPTSLMYGNFSGSIQGNGYTIRNVQLAQTNNSKVNAGLFGQITESAAITDLTLENITFTIQAGTRVAGASFGLLAGTVSNEAEVTGVQILNSHLLIDSASYFGSDDYVIGLVCGMGNASVVEDAQIDCAATDTAPETLNITVSDGQVTLEFATE